MPLKRFRKSEPSSLPTTVGDVRRLGLETTKKSQPESQRLFEELKQSDLYNPDLQLWRQDIDDTYYNLDTQCYAILLEAALNPVSAKENFDKKYKKFYDLGFYNFKSFGWYRALLEAENKLLPSQPESDLGLDCLMNLTRLSRAPEEAEIMASNLNEQYLKEDGLIHDFRQGVTMEHGVPVAYADSRVQLIALLIERISNPHNVAKRFAALRSSAMFDSEQKLFKASFKETKFYSIDQLLSVLIELDLDPHAAREHYQQLLVSNLYDRALRRWRDEFTPGAELKDAYSTDAQLLGLWVMRRFEELEKHSPAIGAEILAQPETLTL